MKLLTTLLLCTFVFTGVAFAENRLIASLTEAEQSYIDISTLGTGAASKAVVLDASGDYTYPATATIVMPSGGSWTASSGSTVDIAGTFKVGGTTVTMSAAELNYLDVTTLGTLAASKAWTSDASLDTIMPTGGLLTVQSGGVVDLASGSTIDIAGTFEISNTAVTSSAAELNYNDITTLGTGAASKAVVLDASGDYTYPATATIKYASGGTLQVNSTDGAVLSAIRTGTDTDLDSGQTSEVVTVTGATASSLCFATITIDATNDVAVSSVVAATNQATVTVTGDPGASGADLAVICFN